jgi:protease IV
MKQFLKYTLASMLGVFLVFTIVFLVMLGIISVISSSEKAVKIEDKSVLKISLNGSIEEQATENPFDVSIPGLPLDTKSITQGLDEILDAIAQAKDNPKIKGIYLEAGTLVTGWSTAEEIRNALLRFKSSGKFIYAYGGLIDQKEYYVCTAADSLFINPEGMINLSGLSATPVFYKKTLDKIGVKAEIFRVGTFKSAVEPYINTCMSDASRLQTQQYLNGMWSHVVSQISSSRKISLEKLNAMVNENTLFVGADILIKKGLADSLVYETDMKGFLKTKANVVGDKSLQLLSVSDVLGSPDQKVNTEPEKIAILYADGEIFDSGTDGIVAKNLIADLETLRKDSLVKAVVLRVNSPGGSAYASEQIWKSVHDLKSIKPVVVSMGDYAASGGYYISTCANKIIASPNTLTGSIGIFGMFFIIDEVAEKIGLSFDVVKTNEHSDLGNITRSMTAFERQKIQNYINHGYDLFVSRCAEGRKMKPEAIRSIAEGRVWTGSQAKKIGLVDDLGGIDKAISEAAKLAKVEKYRLVSYPEKKDFLTELLQEMTGNTKIKIASMIFGAEYEPLLKLKTSKIQTGILAKIDALDIH